MACLTKIEMSNSTVAKYELGRYSFLTLNDHIDDNDKLLLLTTYAYLAIGFSGYYGSFEWSFSHWREECKKNKIPSSLVALEKGSKTTLDFFYYCVSRKIITL